MDIPRKTEIAKAAIDSIIGHDDVIFEAIEISASGLKEHIDARIAEARERRMAKAGVAVVAKPE